ncbi:apextrin [Elysia marginata]|uniref:Apextrin n=1 Tax=Elysia marginata TaxID=1093978 RepID=A0AAV4ED73_9GAST|nr:apextrin [Elysia marginata]
MGCPADSAVFAKTRCFLKIHTQSQSSSDPVNSHSAAFSRQTTSTDGSKKFVTLKFCEVTTHLNTNKWPRGSFCIHKLWKMSCPPEFIFGYVALDTEDTGSKADGSTNVVNRVANPYIYFCCQKTSSASVPIELPTHSPFLLYRYGGVCQAVRGMAVSEEYVQINTEDSSNSDKLSGHHPDIDQPGDSVIKIIQPLLLHKAVDGHNRLYAPRARSGGRAHSGGNPRWLTGRVRQSSALKPTLHRDVITSYVVDLQGLEY